MVLICLPAILIGWSFIMRMSVIVLRLHDYKTSQEDNDNSLDTTHVMSNVSVVDVLIKNHLKFLRICAVVVPPPLLGL